VIRILFGIIATLGLLTALGSVLARNLVHAALFLVAFFFLVACQFVLLEAEFLAAMQVLVYIGAVAILIMFGIMLTRNIQGDETTAGHWAWKLPAAVVGLGILGILLVGIASEGGQPGVPSWTQTVSRRAIPDLTTPPSAGRSPSPEAEAINNMGKAVGDQMMTRYVIPFEVAGLLLTAALVGAIAVARHVGPDEYPSRRGAVATAPSGATEGSADGDGQPLAAKHDVLTTPTSASAPR
jgi:NADH:ubiquinone oxidoreductase subunit 6 (subunit J)